MPQWPTDELKSLIQNWDDIEKEPHNKVNFEIRLQKLTLINIKTTCQLLHQKKLLVEQKRNNLESFINNQLGLQVKTQEHVLGVAITECSEIID